MCRALGAAIATIIPGISKHFYSALRRQQSAKSATKTDGNNKQKKTNSGSESEDKQDDGETKHRDTNIHTHKHHNNKGRTQTSKYLTGFTYVYSRSNNESIFPSMIKQPRKSRTNMIKYLYIYFNYSYKLAYI